MWLEPAPFITEADLPKFRALWENLTTLHEAMKGTRHQVLLTAQEILDLNLELDAMRSEISLEIDVVGPGILDQFRPIDRPIRMIMSTSMAGDIGNGRAARHNRLWTAGVERLAREQPHIAMSWLDATHALVVTHANDIAQIIWNTRTPGE